MTLTAESSSSAPAQAKNWKNPVIYTVLALLSTFLIGLRAPATTISLGVADQVSWLDMDPLQISPVAYGWTASLIMLALAGYALSTRSSSPS